jgi:hypothetical protein
VGQRLILDHESFAVNRPLALIGAAFYPVLVHWLTVSLHVSSPSPENSVPGRSLQVE